MRLSVNTNGQKEKDINVEPMGESGRRLRFY